MADTDSFQERLYGRDEVYEDNVIVKGSGNLQLTTGLGAVKANIERSLITTPGEIFWRPDYGVGITEFIGLPATAANIFEMKNRIRSTISAMEAVEEISELDVVVHGSGLIEVWVVVLIGGVRLETRSELGG